MRIRFRKSSGRAFTALAMALAMTFPGLAARGQQSNPAPAAPPVRAQPLNPAPGGETEASGPEKEELLAYADLLYSHEQFALAARQYQLFLKAHPQSPNLQEGWFRLGECYNKVGQATDAETTFKYVVSNWKSGPYVGSAAFRIAVIRYNAKDFEAAASFFDTAVKNLASEEAKLQAMFYKATCLQLLDKPKEAVAAYDAVAAAKTKDNPFSERCLLETARLQYDLGDAAEAFKRFENLIQSASKPEVKAEALARAGLLAAELGETDKSNPFFEDLLKMEGESPWKAFAGVGLIFNLFTKGEYDKVIATYNRGVFDAPADTRPKMLLVVGHAYRLTGELQAAIELYELVESNYRDRPEGAEAGYRKLQCLYEQNDGGVSIYADRFIEVQQQTDPDSAFVDQAFLIKAEWHFAKAQAGEPGEETTEHYRQAAFAYSSVRADKVEAKYREPQLYKLGWSRIEAGDPNGGVTTLNDFLDQFPDSPLVPSALAKRASTYQILQDFDGALGDFREIAGKHPDAPELEFALQQIALLHGQRRETGEMVEAFRTLLEKFPDTQSAPEAHYWIGVGLMESEKHAEAIPELEIARKTAPNTYLAKASLRIVLAQYQLENLDALTTELEIYLDGKAAADAAQKAAEKAAAAAAQNGSDPPAARRPMDYPAVPPQVLIYAGQRQFDQRDYAHAERLLTAASTPQNPADTTAEVWDVLGQSRMALKEYKTAIEAFDHYLSLTERPSSRGKALLAQGQAWLALGEHDRAREKARECLMSIKEGRTN
ncbi:MAG: tetratricopeptide repeat protein, partial [Verrucomicrobiae bacterium]|nr:tetratricopeptide repeat protein [Verrucomicrobiae bacterium]